VDVFRWSATQLRNQTRQKDRFNSFCDFSACYNGAMALSSDEVRKVGTLARLALTDDEVARLTPELNDLLQQFETLQALDTTGVPPTSHAIPVTALLREDQTGVSLPQSEVLAMGPSVDDVLGGFIVPQVLGGESA
jgi:aspartyl-tRNA(Asn)/glutamyl-tRNA(Gln) amidotransferase subunit C